MYMSIINALVVVLLISVDLSLSEECHTGEYRFLSHADCSKFEICADGYTTVSSCSTGFHWSVSQNTCTNPEDAGCNSTIQGSPDNSTECIVGEYGFRRHPDCDKFQVCINGVLTAQNCDDGLHWSENHNKCLSPAIAKCC
ncbi:hypothetical protein SNE40_004954 [Patella caerulea]|uniref:Chitin-binding type-2 domain-containing protein n=1 Tax=Patella caerulea TaxID=87958 RepID=A0AAN8JZ44_PATCE